MIKNVLCSSFQQHNSVVHIHVSTFFQNLFQFRLLHNIEQSSLCYSVGLLVAFSVTSVKICLCDSMGCSSPVSVHGILQARILELGCHALLQIFLTQGLNPCFLCLLYCRQILYVLSHQGSPFGYPHQI